MFYDVIYIYLSILVSYAISISDDVLVSFNSSTTGVTRVEQELLTLPDHMSSPPILEGFVLLDL
jgi:hypothetical protein